MFENGDNNIYIYIYIYIYIQNHWCPIKVKLLGMQSTPSLPSIPDLSWPSVVAPDSVLSMAQIELFDVENESNIMTYAKLNC